MLFRSDAWYGKEPSTSEQGGYEIRRKDWADALTRVRNSTRPEWEARTVYMVRRNLISPCLFLTICYLPGTCTPFIPLYRRYLPLCVCSPLHLRVTAPHTTHHPSAAPSRPTGRCTKMQRVRTRDLCRPRRPETRNFGMAMASTPNICVSIQ